MEPGRYTLEPRDDGKFVGTDIDHRNKTADVIVTEFDSEGRLVIKEIYHLKVEDKL